MVLSMASFAPQLEKGRVLKRAVKTEVPAVKRERAVDRRREFENNAQLKINNEQKLEIARKQDDKSLTRDLKEVNTPFRSLGSPSRAQGSRGLSRYRFSVSIGRSALTEQRWKSSFANSKPRSGATIHHQHLAGGFATSQGPCQRDAEVCAVEVRCQCWSSRCQCDSSSLFYSVGRKTTSWPRPKPTNFWNPCRQQDSSAQLPSRCRSCHHLEAFSRCRPNYPRRN